MGVKECDTSCDDDGGVATRKWNVVQELDNEGGKLLGPQNWMSKVVTVRVNCEELWMLESGYKLQSAV